MFNKKILCWGHNGNDTDHVVSMLANADNATHHGLISGGMFVTESFGYYHTSIVDSIRNVRLIDFIPELEECRAFITKS